MGKVTAATAAPSVEKDPWAATGIISDIDSLTESKGTIEAIFNTVTVGVDVANIVFNPIATVVSWGVQWLIEHTYPLPDILQLFTGDPEEVQAAAITWNRIATEWDEVATRIESDVNNDLNAQDCLTIQAYGLQAHGLVALFRACALACRTVSSVLNLLSEMVKIVYQMVRDAIADLVGQFVQDVAEAFFSFGTALPAIAAQISAAVSKWVSKITSKGKVVLQGFQKGKELLNSLKATLSKASPIMEKLFNAADKVGQAGGSAAKKTSGFFANASKKAEPYLSKASAGLKKADRRLYDGLKTFDKKVMERYHLDFMKRLGKGAKDGAHEIAYSVVSHQGRVEGFWRNKAALHEASEAAAGQAPSFRTRASNWAFNHIDEARTTGVTRMPRAGKATEYMAGMGVKEGLGQIKYFRGLWNKGTGIYEHSVPPVQPDGAKKK